MPPHSDEPVERAAAEAFALLASDLHEVDGVEETVEAVVQFALQAIKCTAASVVLVTRGARPEPMALTDPRLADLYREQVDAGEGPLLAAIGDDQPIHIPDVTSETRWSPNWAQQVTAAEICSALHVPLTVGGRPSAVLSLYSDRPHAFDDDDLAVAHILARHAAIAIANARHEESMNQAVDARKIVGQAMGMLMERFDLDSDRAFGVLKRYSQDNNRKLRDVAVELIETRKLPGVQPRRR
ncbi:GAF and ANTAR domain-containing protein [Kribbella sp. CA-293567]|nr:GAF and ANTAR domain-containing protein [Kribbella sp. CA-293567]WBQ08707.1 GAF and ANTAR domain-containing protein [Kribbella sp. CA-293567]